MENPNKNKYEQKSFVTRLLRRFGYSGNPLYVMWGTFLIVAIFGAMTAFEISRGPGVAEAAIRSNIAQVETDCKALAATSVRFEIMNKKRALSESEVNETMEPYGKMKGEECVQINNQINATNIE